MKFFHLSDLHIGKRVNEFSMLDDQKYILAQILELSKEEQPDAVLIAGDVYDKSMPSAEAVGVFDDFLYELSETGTEIFVISGNHDSPERIAYGGRLMREKIHMSPVYSGKTMPAVLTDADGPVYVYSLPFVKPGIVRQYFPEAEIENYTDALRTVIEAMQIDPKKRNILICHQFVTGAARSDSEETVGGLDNVNAEVFDPFDYVALGHIHSPQKAGRETIRYCGTPLKYSFSEAEDRKSVTVVEMKQKGECTLHFLPLKPKRDLRKLRGSYAQLMERAFIDSQSTEDYLQITLTDEEEYPGAFHILRQQYPNLMKFSYDNTRTRTAGYKGAEVQLQSKSPLELVSEFYRLQNGSDMSREQLQFTDGLIRKLWDIE